MKKNNFIKKNSGLKDRSELQESLAITLIQKLEQISLSKTETDTMRENLRAYAELHTVPISTQSTSGILSPFSFAYRSSYIRTYSRAIAAVAFVILLLVGTTGVTYAAENTLPGQPLYGVKVSIVEPLQGALITDPVKKAEWQNELTQRRLTEAATLAAENDLSSSTQAYLAQAVTAHVEQSEEDSNQLSASGKASDALSVRSDLEARLSARADFLAFIAPELAAAGDSTTTQAIDGLLATIQTDRQEVRDSRIATEMALSGEASSTLAIEQTPMESAMANNDSLSASTSDAVAINSGTSTPAQEQTLAYISAQASERKQEEQQLFQASSALFKLLPPLTGTASTTLAASTTTQEASSTIDVAPDSSSSDAASTTPKFPFYKLRKEELKTSEKL